MSDPPPARWPRWPEKQRSLRKKVAGLIHPAPACTAELMATLAEAEDNQVIGADARVMLERVIAMAEMSAGQIMVPAPRMDLIDIDAAPEALLQLVISAAHSRFPVYQGARENIIGILLAKDLLKLQRAPGLNIRTLLRAPVFVPESKGLYELLREFRGKRNHLAIVIDEFGRVAGLVTIEDVLEQIVGEIEDEFDIPEDEGDIFGLADHSYRVSGDTPIERVAQAFAVSIPASAGQHEQFETIGGLIAHEMGHMPRRGEQLQLAGLCFAVLHTKGGAVRWFKVSRLEGNGAGA